MKKRLASFFLALAVMLSILPSTAFAVDGSGSGFRDVKPTDWFFEAVDYAVQKNLMNGTGSNAFSPNGTTTRGMLVTILYRMEGEPSVTGTVFSDVPKGQWYTDAVIWANEKGIVNGYGNGTFGPNNTITREQMAVILYRYAQNKGHDITATDSLTAFSDKGKVSGYAVQAMGWAVGSGLITGVSENVLSPQSSATRAQMATILMRFCQQIANGENTGLLYSVSAIEATGSSAEVTVNTIAACALELTFLDDNEGKNLFTVSTEIGRNLEMSSVNVSLPQSLPKYFVATAVLKDSSGKVLCEPYKTLRNTSSYEKFASKTARDFEEELVLNLDRDTRNNFAVLAENVTRVDCTDTVNTCSLRDGIFTFVHADSQLDDISTGDVVAIFAENEMLTAIVAGSVTRDGDTVSITMSAEAALQEIYQYIKIDIQETADEFYEESNPVLAYVPNSSGIAYGSPVASWLDDLKGALRFKDKPANINSKGELGQSVKVSLSDSVKLTVSTSFSVKYSLTLSYDIAVFGDKSVDYSYKMEIEGVANAKIGSESKGDSTNDELETFKLTTKEVGLDLGKYTIPTPLPGVFISLKLMAPIKLSVSGSLEVEQKIKLTTGAEIHWDNEDGPQKTSFTSKENNLTVKTGAEVSASVGVVLSAGVDIMSVVSADVSAEVGGKVTAKAEKAWYEQTNAPSRHLCDVCLSGDTKAYVKVGAKAEIGIAEVKLSYTILDATLINAEFNKHDFYCSIDKLLAGDKDFWGWDTKCPNKAYRITVLAKDQKGNLIEDQAISILPINNNQLGAQQLKSGEFVYLPNGSYSAYAAGSDGKPYSKEFTVSGKEQEVTIELPLNAVGATLRSEVVVDMYTGYPQIRYYNDMGQIVYCIRLTSTWDAGAVDQYPEGYQLELCGVSFAYDTLGQLSHSRIEVDISYWWDEKPQYLSYKYEGNQIKAYESDGTYQFSMDKNWNITEEVIGDGTRNAQYTYDNQGRVTSLVKTDSDNTANIKVTYDSNGNVTGYNEIGVYNPGTEYEFGYERNRKFTYESGHLIRLDDSDYNMWPWQFSYDGNGQMSELLVKDLDDGTHGGQFIATPDDAEWPEWRGMWSTWRYLFTVKEQNQKPALFIKGSLTGWAPDESREESFTIPSA